MITTRKKGQKSGGFCLFLFIFLNILGLFLLRTKIGRGGSQT